MQRFRAHLRRIPLSISCNIVWSRACAGRLFHISNSWPIFRLRSFLRQSERPSSALLHDLTLILQAGVRASFPQGSFVFVHCTSSSGLFPSSAGAVARGDGPTAIVPQAVALLRSLAKLRLDAGYIGMPPSRAMECGRR